MIKINENYDVTCIDISFEGYGVCKINNFIVFVPNFITSETAKIKITKLEKNYGYGEIFELIKLSKYRIKPNCDDISPLSHISYDYQVIIKNNIVKNTFKKLNLNIKINDIIKMEDPFNYRNKIKISVGIKADKLICGYYKNNTHDIIPFNDNIIFSKKANSILKKLISLLENYKENIKHIIIKEGFKTNEIMLVIVTNEIKIDNIDEIIKEFNLTTIIQIIDNKEIILYGPGYIYDILDDIKLKISPNSFYQVNPVQTEKLYKKAIEIANLNKNDIIIDAYSGIGSISFYISKYVKKVYGIEIEKNAVNDALYNAKINNIKNVKFIFGDVEKEILNFKDKKIDVIFLDPPRKGCSKKFLNTILTLKPKKIIYISCNINTQVRDVKLLLDNGYMFNEVHTVDMFPHTSHIENIICLNKRSDYK